MMADLAGIDLELTALGSMPKDIASLIGRHVGAKLSLDEVDAALAELAGGIVVAGAPLEGRDQFLSSPAPAVAWGPPESLSDVQRVSPPRQSTAPAGFRDGFASLLDQDLDPNEFPRTSAPPPPAQAADAEESDDFEMLIEDEELIELEADE